MIEEGGLIRTTSKESILSAYSHVGDWEIGDRCQIGGRAGNIVHIGPVRFASGEWIGVVLDQPLGKNDGSVDGHRYFNCEPHHGLFCKASKLERILPLSPLVETQQINPYCKEYGMEIGDRIIISSGKYGTLRFLGKTEFKDGVWAGIELDQPVGKNDGSVQGKRYFSCKAPYGLFAAASKVVRAPEQVPPKIKIRHTKTSALRQRCGSHDSLSSIGASSVASSQMSKYNFSNAPRSVQRPLIVSSVRGQDDLFKTLQESLKEKETHLEQMIKERDLERNEMATLSNRCEEAEAKAAHLESEKAIANQQIELLKVKLKRVETKFQEAGNTVNDLSIQLKEKNDALEDLMFRCDEEAILNAELKEKIEELETKYCIKESGNKESTAMLTIETTKQTQEQMEPHINDRFAFEQEKLSVCSAMKNVFLRYKQDFSELMQLVLHDGAVGITDESEAVTSTCGEDFFSELKGILEELNGLAKYHSVAKKAVKEKLKKDEEEMENLRMQLEALKNLPDNETHFVSQKDELESYQVTISQLRKKLEGAETKIAELSKICDALEITKASLKAENERKEREVEFEISKKELDKVHSEVRNLQELQKKAEIDKLKLVQSCDCLEKSNKKLTDFESLHLQNTQLEDKLRKVDSEKQALKLSVSRNEAEYSVARSEIDELAHQVDRLRVDLDEANSSNENLKKEIMLLLDARNKTLVQVTELQEINESLKNELSAAKTSFRTLENVHNALKNTSEKKEAEFQKLEENFSLLQEHLAADLEKELKEKEAADYVTTLSKLQFENACMQRRLHDLEAEKESFSKGVDELNLKYARLKEHNEVLTQSLNDRVNLVNQYQEKMNMLQTRLQAAEKCLGLANCEGESLEEALSNLLAERTCLIGLEKESKKEIEQMLADKEKYLLDLATMEKRLSELKKERDALTASLNNIQNHLHETNDLEIEPSEKAEVIANMSALKNSTVNINKLNDKTAVDSNSMAEKLEKDWNNGVMELTGKEIGTKSVIDRNESQNVILGLPRAEFLDLSKKQAEDEVVASEARQCSALFLNSEEKWKKKEADYLQTIEELKKAVGKTETEKIEELKRDIAFLNSIIAEQYKKEEDLKDRIAILNSIPANETLEEMKHKVTNKIPPRLYCDICEQFDMHDTTYCPKQTEVKVENVAYSQNYAKKAPPPRPYCVLCEEFGHETSSCSKMQF